MSRKSFHVKQDIVMAGLTGQPSNPEEGQFYFDSNLHKFFQYTNGSWKQFGSSASGVVNYIANGDAEDGVITPFYEYANTPGSQPVNGIGGSPVPFLTINSTNPLAGTKDFSYAKDANNRQGQGWAVPFTIDGYLATSKAPLQINIQYITTGAFTTGPSSDLTIWVYDVANSVLIPVSSPNINLATGLYQATWQPANVGATSYRLIGHISTTNASAWTFEFDNVQVGPASLGVVASNGDRQVEYQSVGSGQIGPIGTGLQTVPATFVAKATARYRVYLDGTGMYTNSEVFLNIVANTGSPNVVSQALNIGAGNGIWVPVYVELIVDLVEGVSYQFQLNASVSGTAYLYLNAPLGLEQITPSTSQFAGSSKTLASNLIAQGTRVTSTPIQIGQYRTYIKTASTHAGTDSAPSVPPTVSNGMLIYGNVPFASAGTAGQIGRWEIFVGYNRSVKPLYFSGAGRTGQVDPKPFFRGDFTNLEGTFFSYNPDTGIAIVDCFEQTAGTTTRNAAETYNPNGGDLTQLASIYFDIEISDNPVGIGFGQSRIKKSNSTGTFWSIPLGGSFFPVQDPTTAVLSVTVSCDGGDVEVGLMDDGSGTPGYVAGDDRDHLYQIVTVQFKCDGVVVAAQQMYNQNNIGIHELEVPPNGFRFTHTPAPGVHTYTVEASQSGTSTGNNSGMGQVVLYARPMA